jgi:hypothetical protein
MIYMFFFNVALEAILYRGPGKIVLAIPACATAPWQIIREGLLWLPLQPRGISSPKSDTINGAVLEKALTIPQDLDDKDISLQVSGPGNGYMNQIRRLFFPCGFKASPQSTSRLFF